MRARLSPRCRQSRRYNGTKTSGRMRRAAGGNWEPVERTNLDVCKRSQSDGSQSRCSKLGDASRSRGKFRSPIAAGLLRDMRLARGRQLDSNPTFAPRPHAVFDASITVATTRSTHLDRFRTARRPQPAANYHYIHQAGPANGLREARHTPWPHASCNRRSTKSASRNALGWQEEMTNVRSRSSRRQTKASNSSRASTISSPPRKMLRRRRSWRTRSRRRSRSCSDHETR